MEYFNLQDIQQKYKIKNTAVLDSLNDFLLDNISTEVSSRNIANTLTSNGTKIDDKTISSYLKYLCASYVFYKIRRYDISREETFEREISPLLSIKDAYPKMIIARTKHPETQHEGVRIVDLAEWVMKK